MLLLVLIRSVTADPRTSTKDTKQLFLLALHFATTASTVLKRNPLYVSAFPELVVPTETKRPTPPDIVMSVRLWLHFRWISTTLRPSSSSSNTMSAGNLRGCTLACPLKLNEGSNVTTNGFLAATTEKFPSSNSSSSRGRSLQKEAGCRYLTSHGQLFPFLPEHNCHNSPHSHHHHHHPHDQHLAQTTVSVLGSSRSLRSANGFAAGNRATSSLVSIFFIKLVLLINLVILN